LHDAFFSFGYSVQPPTSTCIYLPAVHLHEKYPCDDLFHSPGSVICCSEAPGTFAGMPFCVGYIREIERNRIHKNWVLKLGLFISCFYPLLNYLTIFVKTRIVLWSHLQISSKMLVRENLSFSGKLRPQ